jgi:putative sigma-54 modulation protein
MKNEFVFLHLDHSDALQDYAVKRVEKLSKFEVAPVHCHWVFSAQRQDRQVELVIAGKNTQLTAKAVSEDLYKSIDMVVDKMFKQMEKKKEVTKSKGRASARAVRKVKRRNVV